MAAIAAVNITPATEIDDAGTGTACAAGDHTFTPTVPLDRVLFRLTDTGGGGNVTFNAGDTNPAQSAGQGNLVIAVANGVTSWVGGLESARFMQDNGTISITDAANTTITAFQIINAL